MSSRSIDDLHPQFKPMASQFLILAQQAGLDVLIYCTYRSNQEQAVLYAQGRTTPGDRVTDAPAGQSAHNYGLAFDGVPMLNGKPQWQREAPQWQIYGQVADAAGLEWAGAPKFPFHEFPHVQMINWRMYIHNPTSVST